MKHHNPDVHLTDEEVLRAMIDPSDLDPTRQAHFQSCRHCQGQAENLTHLYSRLGQMAQQMAPKPRKSFSVPAHRAPAGRWYLKPAMAAGVLGFLLFAVTLWGPFTQMSPTPTPEVAQNFENDDQLMEEIDMLVENALPEKYQQMAALADDRSFEDLDEFIDWMVPSPEEPDDWEQPATQERKSRQEPLAWSDSMIDSERGIV